MASQRRHGDLMREAQQLLAQAVNKAMLAGVEAYQLGYDRGGAVNWSPLLQQGWLNGFDAEQRRGAALARDAAACGVGGFLRRSLPPGDRDEELVDG